jgi:hypothetical protein
VSYRVTLLVLAALCFAGPSPAFVTELFSFRLPPGWKCTNTARRWVCTSPLTHERDNTFVVSASSDVPPVATLDLLEEQLRKVLDESLKAKKYPGGVVYPSHRITFAGVTWTDTLQKNLSGAGVTVRQLATLLKDDGRDVSAIFGYSVSDPLQARLRPQLEAVVASLRPTCWASPKYKPGPGKSFSEQCIGGDAVACFIDMQRHLIPAAADRQREVFAKACDAGCDEACVALSAFLLKMPSEKVAHEKALIAACNRGLPEVCSILGMVAAEKKDAIHAIPLLRKGCEGGIVSSCRAAFVFLKDQKDKDKWLRSACQAGDGAVCFALAQQSKKDKALALELHRDGCQGGYAGSCLLLSKETSGIASISYLEYGTRLLSIDCDGGRQESCATLKKLRALSGK